MLNAAIINPKDDEELALTLNGRKKKLQREDFIRSAATLGIENVIVERLINKYIKLLPKFETVIKSSFLSAELKRKVWRIVEGPACEAFARAINGKNNNAMDIPCSLYDVLRLFQLFESFRITEK